MFFLDKLILFRGGPFKGEARKYNVSHPLESRDSVCLLSELATGSLQGNFAHNLPGVGDVVDLPRPPIDGEALGAAADDDDDDLRW